MVFFLYTVIYPQSQLKRVRMKRMARLKAMEKRHGCKVLTMIHRREAISFFGLPAYQFIDEEDAEQILRWIRKYGDYPLDLILHTPGGQLHASIQIARALRKHPKKTRVFIPHYSMSGGTIIALAADEIVMDKDAVIGPIDPQIGDFVRGTLPCPFLDLCRRNEKRKCRRCHPCHERHLQKSPQTYPKCCKRAS